MKKLARTLTLILALIMVMTMLSACTQQTNPTGEPDDTNEEVVLNFWTHYTDDIEFTKKKLEDFNSEYAGRIRVELKHITDDYNNVLLLALKNGDGPDIFADGIALMQLVEQNYVAPIDDLISPEMAARVEDKVAIGDNYLDGKRYSMPFRGNNFRLAWNKELFEAAGLDPEAPPTNYEEIISYAKTITEYGKTQESQKYGFMLPTGESWIWWIYGTQMANINGQSKYDFATGEFKWEAYKPVMELYLQLQNDGSLFPGGNTMQNDPARAQFSAGNVGMIIAASWDVGVFNDQFPATMDWGVAQLPSYDGELHGYPQLDASSYLFVNNASKNKEAAITFNEYLLSDDTLVEYYEGGYGVPVYDGISEKVKNMPERPGFAGFADISSDRAYPYEAPVQIEGAGYGEVMTDVMNGAITLDEAINDLNKRYNEAVKKGVDSGEFELDDYIVPDFTTLNPFGN